MRFSRLLPGPAAVAAAVAITVAGLVGGGWLGARLLDAETNRQGERSAAATMDAFAPNPYGSFVGGYIAMLQRFKE
jgi:Kef-type K+ transport system membrane component KefB